MLKRSMMSWTICGIFRHGLKYFKDKWQLEKECTLTWTWRPFTMVGIPTMRLFFVSTEHIRSCASLLNWQRTCMFGSNQDGVLSIAQLIRWAHHQESHREIFTDSIRVEMPNLRARMHGCSECIMKKRIYLQNTMNLEMRFLNTSAISPSWETQVFCLVWIQNMILGLDFEGT